MRINKGAIFDVIIVGAGHGGLSVSYFLKEKNVNHLVFERGKIGESWRSQRWDSFALNTSNWMSMLPGDTYEGDFRNGFMDRDEFVAYLSKYAKRFQLPVKEGTNVISVKQRPESGVFEVNIENEALQDHIYCRQFVLASGAMSAPKT
ncbi:MAG: NAD(P)-binding domain-containing protein, partial [Bacteroidia bacterium]|nr:NAD(P)-binding domain-containing protein [Bacteroidia bacterium]